MDDNQRTCTPGRFGSLPALSVPPGRAELAGEGSFVSRCGDFHRNQHKARARELP